ncbi:MAG: sulfatase [Akkermansiaceae bacterium]|jgi:arylsulfatase A-like enzyme|nr:sulfatase [Akkermansiaceae bacterium]
MKSIIQVLSLALLTALVPAAEKAPNVILIYVDDLGYGDLACYGSEKNKTPHIDRLAQGGMRFTDYYSASSVCTPSRAALLSGCYPSRIGCENFGPKGYAAVLFPGMAEGIHADEKLLPELLKEKNYATAIIGKWHLGDQPEHLPTRHGFDTYFGIPYSNDMALMPKRPDSPPLPLMRDEEVIQEQPAQGPLLERYTVEAIEFIRRHREQPFFLYFAHLHVHLPHYVMAPFASSSSTYGGALTAVDWSTGALMAELDRLGIADNTIIIFTSDNGSRVDSHGGSNAPLRGRKAETWEGGMRVPCIVRWPARIPAGAVCKEVVSALDFLPTLAPLAGHESETLPACDGHNVLPLWLGKPEARSPYEHFFYSRRGEIEAVRSGPWKLREVFVGKPGEAKETVSLYHLIDDPAEANDVAGSHPDIVARLSRELDAMRAKLGDTRRGIKGSETRPHAKVADPKPLTTKDPQDHYVVPSYLLDETG